jgi:malonyl-CoA O-methyltransferase
MPTREGIHQLNQAIVRSHFGRAAAHYDGSAVLQAEVQSRLLERLELTALSPERILDIGTGTGRALKPLAERYPEARVIGADFALPMLARARHRRRRLRRFECVATWAEALPFAPNSFDLVFSNFMLQWSDPEKTLADLQTILAGRSLLLFTTLGPDTLRELRAAWAEADEQPRVNDFTDMHDIGDALVRAGFVEPTMDVEYLTLTYENVEGLMRDLKTTGATNAMEDRPRSLAGKGKWAAMKQAYEYFRAEGRLPATFEVVYGTAWTPVRLPRR